MSYRTISAKTSEIRRAWLDPELTLPQAAASVGMSKDALQARARDLKLPARRTGRRERIRPHMERDFRLMWIAGVSAREIGRHFKCSYFSVINTAIRLGLDLRGKGYRPRMTLAQFFETRLAITMRHDAELRRAREKEARRA